MSSDLSPYRGQLPAKALPRAAHLSPLPITRQGRALSRSDKQAERLARDDYNAARNELHRTHLGVIVEKAQSQARAELAMDAVLHAQTVDTLVTNLSAGKPALELILRGIQDAHMTGEQQRILRRGLGF